MKWNSRFFVPGLAAFALMMALVMAGCNPGDIPGTETQTVATPTANPPAGEVASDTEITLKSATQGADIYYTTNGSTPYGPSSDGMASNGIRYLDYNKPVITTETTIKAIAVKSGMKDSDVLTAEYTIDLNKVATPVANPPAGAVASGTKITLTTTTEGASIYYTTDGSTPSKTNGTRYSDDNKPTKKSEGTSTIKAIAVKNGMTDSNILTAAYTIGTGGSFTVTFIANEGTPAPQVQTVASGGKVTEPEEMTRTDCTFGGWYKEAAFTNKWNFTDDTVTANITLYAQWFDSDFPANAAIAQTFTVANAAQWGEAVAAIKAGGNKKNYVINITANFDIAGSTSEYEYTFGDSASDIIVSIRKGGATNPEIGLSSTGNLLNIRYYHSVILRDVTLRGISDNDSSVVHVRNSSTFDMKGSAKVTGNTTNIGGGVYVSGTFTMQDNATVSGNTANYDGGGVHISSGTFTMQNSATISNNTADRSGGGVYVSGTFIMRDNATVSNNTTAGSGGGVYISGGTFTMQNSATVSGNTVSDTGTGGGVFVNSGTFTMQDGAAISNNTADSYGGGVDVRSGTFTMQDSATVSGNIANYRGGGVYVNSNYNSSTFIMRGNATVSGNTADDSAGGVYIYGGTFIMQDGATVSGNIANDNGGGVYVYSGTFHITGGTIYGSDAETGLKNTGTYAALYGRAEYGTGGTGGAAWTANGTLSSTDTTIKVVNGFLVLEGSENPTPLTNGLWRDGEITSSGASTLWYSFDVTSGAYYYLWWEDSNQKGNGSKTLDIVVSAYYSIGSNIIVGINNGWNTSQSFIATRDGTVKVKVEPKTSDATGTFAVAYSTINRRPSSETDPIPMPNGSWVNGEILSGQDAHWFSFPVIANSTYYVWWNELAQNGDIWSGIKTLDVIVSAYYSNGSSIFENKDDGWDHTDRQTFTAASAGTVTVKVKPKTGGQTGTFAVAYSRSTTRPNLGTEKDRIQLISEVWANDEIPADSGVLWYRISTSTGSTFYLWWNDSKQGNGTKTLDVKVSVYSSSGTSIFENEDDGWGSNSGVSSSSYSIYSSGSGIYYIKVEPKTGGQTGTFAIAYKLTTNSRP